MDSVNTTVKDNYDRVGLQFFFFKYSNTSNFNRILAYNK